MIQGILVGKVTDAPRSFPLKSGSGSMCVFNVKQSVVAGDKVFFTFFKVACFGVTCGQVDALKLQPGDAVVVAFRSVECEVYESKKEPGKWKGAPKLVASAVQFADEEPVAGQSQQPAQAAPVRESTPPPRPVQTQAEADTDVPF